MATPTVIREAKRQGLVCVPGVATPTEAFAALAPARMDSKMFPVRPVAAVGAEGVARGAAAGNAGVSRSVASDPTTWVPIGPPARTASARDRISTQPGATVEHVRSAAAAYAAAFRALPKRPAVAPGSQ